MPAPDFTPLIARMKELGYDIAPMPSLEQTFVPCEACRENGGFDQDGTKYHCLYCMGSGQIPDATLQKWLKQMSGIMDKAYGRKERG